MDRQELEAWLRLTLTPGVGNDTARRLLAAFGLPQHVFAQSSTALRQLLTPAQASALAQPPDDLATQLQTCLDWLDAAEDGMPRRIVSLGDAAYPQALLAIEDPPCLLYLLGRLATLDDGSDTATTLTGQAQTAIESGANHWPLRAMAIVGSRNPTPQGSANARQFARTLAAQGICVVSGLALGIDGAAHEGALDGAPPSAPGPATIAVIGTGIDRVYPRQHRDLAHRIAVRGLIVSEYPLGTPPLPGNFPRRNRLIAGLSQGTLVVE
ncbi:MAG TPA: DNA-processing protein DprA, partial [Ottowia sp.]|nr:DNA-processing protein DprA [Ottowia sp.]